MGFWLWERKQKKREVHLPVYNMEGKGEGKSEEFGVC